MSKYSNFIPSSVISKIEYSTDDELIKSTKKLYLTQIENKHGGKNFLEIIASKYEINGNDLVDALSNILKLSEVYYYLCYSFTSKQSKEVCTFDSKYLFSWDEIPGNDNLRLIDFLIQKFSIDWVKTAKIEKIDNDKTIRVSTEKNFLLLKLNNDKTKLNVEINGGLTDEFIAKSENDKLNIYENIQFNTEIFNDFGQPIWFENLTPSPKLWNAIREDNNNNHIFLTYIHLGVENTYFDPVTLFFEKYNETALINYRVHFEDNIIEISSKNSNQKAIRDSLTNLSQILKLSNIEFKPIKDKDIRNFDSTVEKVTYERREGDEASASMTRVNKESDTRNDSLRTELNNREFRNEHGLLILENDIRSVVGLSSGERGKIQIKSHLSPENQIKMVHKIIDILRW